MLEDVLLSIPSAQWIVAQVVVFDWDDGPRQGLCVLAEPAAEFVFELVAEERNPEGLDMRIVRLKELPPNSVAQLTSALGQLGLGPVNKPVWIPIWRFPSEEDRGRIEQAIEFLESAARRTDVLVS